MSTLSWVTSDNIMSNETTVAELFDLAITAEKMTEELYRGFEARFAHHQEVAAFWRQYALEEVGHARWLENLRDRLAPERLSAPADPGALEDVRRALGLSVEKMLESTRNLDDAYELANELEHSETNAIFEFLITAFAQDPKTRAFLRAQLSEHIVKLTLKFPAAFKSATTRREIKALAIRA